MPLVSVIVPNYNHAPFLARRLDSVVGQRFRDFELIILDDASTDGSRAVIERYLADPRARFIPSQSNSGSPFVQWNRGVAEARGEYVWIAESDDYAEPDLLSELVPLLEASAQVRLAFCRSWKTDERDGDLGLNEVPDYAPGRWERDYRDSGRRECAECLLWANTIPNASAALFRRDAFLQIGGAPTGLRLCGDWLTWVRLLREGDVAYRARPLNHFRHHLSSVRSAVGWRQFFDERWVVQREILRQGGVSRGARRKLAEQVADEAVSRLRLAPPGGWAAEARSVARLFGGYLARHPGALGRELSTRLRRKLAPPRATSRP